MKKYRIVKGGRLDNLIYCIKASADFVLGFAFLPLFAVLFVGILG